MTLISNNFAKTPIDTEDGVEAAAGIAPAGPSDLPVDEAGRGLAEGESVLGAAEVAALDWSGMSAEGDAGLFAPQLRTASAYGVSFGQQASIWPASSPVATGIDLAVQDSGTTFAVSSFGTCGCPMCGDGVADSEAIAAFWESDGAPTTTGTITQLANYLRVDFWDDIYSWTPLQYNVTTNGNNGVLRYDLDGWTGSLDTNFGPYSDSNGMSSSALRDLIRDAFDWYGQVLGISFIEDNSGSTAVDFFFTDADSGSNYAASRTFSPGGGNIDYTVINITNTSATNGKYATILHEIGHALGLGHQGPYNTSATFGVDAEFLNDSYQLSNMSYFSVNENPNVTGSNVRSVTMQIADLHALNQIYSGQGYGPYANAFTGNTVYGVGTNITAVQSRFLNQLTTHAATNLFTIVDGGGVDTVDFSNFTANQNINLTVITSSATSGVYSSVGGLTNNMAIAVGTIIENATSGSGNDTLTGNQYDNTLAAGEGNNLAYGGSGADSITSGAGLDTLYGGSGDDTIKGGGGADQIFGGNDNDILKGAAGNDTLYAGSGVDTIYGDDNNDRIVVHATSTMANAEFYGGNGVDVFEVNGTGTWDMRNSTLSGFEEIEFYANTASNKEVYITGAQAVGLGPTARIDGNASADASDTLAIYMEDSATTVLDMSGWIFQDWNTISGTVDYLYVNGSSQGDTITGGAAATFVSAGEGADIIYGGALNDTLKGGAGSDTLYGGAGNDAMYGNSALPGTDSTNRFYGGLGNDTAYGGTGSDYFYGAADASTSAFYGNDGNDFLYKASGTTLNNSESWYGGDGVDYLFWTDANIGSTRVVNLATGFITSAGNNRDVVQGIENVRVYNGAGVIGDAGANDIRAYGGFDNDIDGGAGNDLVYGGDGNDTIRGGTGVDTIYGGSGNDVLHDGNDLVGADGLYGGLGDDVLIKESTTDLGIEKVWHGGSDTDTLDWTNPMIGFAGTRVVNLSTGRITYNGQDRDILTLIENVIVRNYAGIVGDGNANVLTAVGEFVNTIEGGGGDDTIDAGGGNDTVYGDAGADSIQGGTGSDLIFGGTENDTIDGWEGSDALYGGDGEDAIFGFSGDDTFYGGAGTDSLHGEAGNDVMYLYAGEGWDNFYGGADTDSVYFDVTAKLTIDMAAGTYTAGTSGSRAFDSIEFVSAGSGNDTISGTTGAETIYGGAGKDEISGVGGDDQLHGGQGNDILRSGTGAASMYGDQGNDRFFLSDGPSGVVAMDGGDGGKDWLDLSESTFQHTVDLAAGTVTDGVLTHTVTLIENIQGNATSEVLGGSSANNQINGGDGDDVINGLFGRDTLAGGLGNDTIDGGASDDRLSGNGGNDVLYGGVNNDTLYGDNGDDLLFGGNGNDWLEGGNNRDTLNGGAGTDTLIGGAWADTFVFGSAAEIGIGATSDRIEDFLSGTDKIDLTAFGGLSFIGTTGFSGTAGELRFFSLAGVTYLAADLNGNSSANFEIILTNGTSLVAGDLIL